MLLKNIQFLRAAAAMVVIMFHMAAYLQQAPHGLQYLHRFFAQFGYAGVDVFFVISGYVIWISTHGREKPVGPGLFAYRRATRIYLGYWPYFLLVMLILGFQAPHLLAEKNVWGSLFLTELAIPNLVLQVAWTLSFELYFYALFTAFLWFSLHQSKRLLLLFALLIVVVQSTALIWTDAYQAAHIAQASVLITFFFSPFCLQFLVGVAIAIYFEQHRIQSLKTVFAGCAALFILTLWVQSAWLPEGHYLYMGQYTPWRVLLFGGIAWLLVAGMIEWELRSRQLMPRVAMMFGDASYSLYLSHTPILFLFSQMGWMAWAQSNAWYHGVAVLVLIAVILTYSVLHYRMIELPLMRLARGQAKKWFA